MMKTQMPALACLFSALGALVCWAEDVEFVDCAKCEKRMRLAADASGATVNLARLRDDNPDAATLERRKAAMTARAQSILAAARDTRMPNRKRPLMGWSSWNTFGLEIGDRLILEIAEAMATNGLKAAGYRYVNIDDGFFCGHDEHGRLRIIEKRFPKGLKPVVDGIHALGMKAGIYSDAGIDTCGSNNDPAGRGSGLYGHDREDCEFHFVENGFDFFKVDYCGGARMGLDERTRYTEIANAIRATGRDVRFNVCRWAYPGTWISEIAESWRTTGDIRASWERVKELVEKNFYLSPYASLGHYNDMDMLEVGQLKGRMKTWPVFGKRDKGFTREEETTHFGLWCILSSPLLMGCDVRTIDPESLKLATNPYLLSMNQNDLGVQAYPVRRDGDAVVFVKDCGERFGTARYVALYNGSDKDYEFSFAFSDLELGGKVGVVDLVEAADIGEGEGLFVMKVAPHASKFYRMDAERRLTQEVYEAENAYLHDFQTVNPATEALTPHFVSERKASGQVAVGLLGMRPGNDLVWKEVRVAADGLYDFEFACFNRTPEVRSFDVEVDGHAVATVRVPYQVWELTKVRIEVPLAAGVHRVRLSNDAAPMPVIDCLRVTPLLHPGRQLFVDDLLIERTDLTRVWKEPVKFSGNPVLKPETPLEKGLEGHCPMAAPFSGGVWYDDADGLYKCWYCAGWFDGTAYAWSTNGLDWVRPDLAAEPGTNRVIPRRGERDSASVVLDPDAADGNRFKMLVWSRPQGGELFVSKNGTDWSEPTGWGNRWGDRSTIFRDPFRNLWVYSIRYSYPRRMRGRVETADFLAGAKLDKRAFKGNWFVPQTNEVGVYNVDCVAYESVMLAAVTVMTGPDNGHWMKCGLPKKTDLHLAFSRNGVDFTRAPDAFLKGTRRSGDWDYGYLHSNSGVCLVRDDELWFYYTGFAGDTNRLENVPAKNGMYANASMGIAKLRRDGFCAMEGTGELVTKELPVSGRHLFVNAKGRLTVKVGDTTVGTFDGDSTRAQVADLSAFRGKSVRLTFALTAGELYSFWTTDDPAGRSGGYLAGGSPEATGLRDR